MDQAKERNSMEQLENKKYLSHHQSPPDDEDEDQDDDEEEHLPVGVKYGSVR